MLEIANRFCGLVTAVPHDNSGWIGNLLVPYQRRGKGYGSRLFKSAVADLEKTGISSIWLTASEFGRPIYEKAGFVAVDRIERLVLPAAERDSGELKDAQQGILLQVDRDIWGEDRSSLLSQLLGNGQVFCSGESVALLQGGDDMQIIGPWYGKDEADHRRLLRQIVMVANPASELVIDLFASSSLQEILVESGFACSGSSQLMVRGEAHADLARMGSLASLGSVG